MINREVGVDIVDIRRIRRSYERYGEKFLRRVLTEHEISYCKTKKDMMPSVAARFAAKEAVSKAIGSGMSRGFSWKSVEVVNDKKGKPLLKVLDSQFGIADEQIRVSLSHSGDYAVAFVLLDPESRGPA
ncbi:MAG: holo-ACP synthase [Chlorobiales bacterium]|nr:holo-ACP synthase [Chlorobiales bacterium]